jgi:hypothetical protein
MPRDHPKLTWNATWRHHSKHLQKNTARFLSYFNLHPLYSFLHVLSSAPLSPPPATTMDGRRLRPPSCILPATHPLSYLSPLPSTFISSAVGAVVLVDGAAVVCGARRRATRRQPVTGGAVAASRPRRSKGQWRKGTGRTRVAARCSP